MKIFHKILAAASLSSLIPILVICLFALQFERHHKSELIKELRDAPIEEIELRYGDQEVPVFNLIFDQDTGKVLSFRGVLIDNVYSARLLQKKKKLSKAKTQKAYLDGKAYKGVCWSGKGGMGNCRFFRNSILKDEVSLFVNIVIIILLVSSILVLIAVYAVSRHIAKPLESLIEYVGSLEKDKYEFEMMPDGEDEVAQLVKELREYSDNAHRYRQQLSQQEKEVAIGRLSSYIAHDMRSPLSVLKSYVNLNPDQMSEGEAEEYHDAAKRSVGKLLHMADDLVDYAKASKIERSHQDVRKMICSEVISETSKDAEANSVKVICDVADEIYANIDGYRIERVLVNLVNNAIQAARYGSEILVDAQITGDDLIIKVEDNGQGIDSENLPHIFDSFFTKGKKGGTGLGLAYCKQVVEAHAGTIEVESEQDEGTTFTITLPNCVVHNASMVAENKEDAVDDKVRQEVGVLIADDDANVRQQWQRIVKEHGGQVVKCASTVEEVEADNSLDYGKIDTAIVDYEYKGSTKDGIDLASHLKSKGVKKVFLCTGFYDDTQVVSRAEQAGVESIIPKPIDEDDVPQM